MKLQNVFRRVSQVSRGATDTVDGEDSKVKTPGRLFGRALVELCGGDGQTDLPPPVCNMLSQLFQKGPGNCHQSNNQLFSIFLSFATHISWPKPFLAASAFSFLAWSHTHFKKHCCAQKNLFSHMNPVTQASDSPTTFLSTPPYHQPHIHACKFQRLLEYSGEVLMSGWWGTCESA